MIDFGKMLDYVKRFNKKILFQRFGFIFDTPQFKYYLDTPKEFLNGLKSQINSISYFDNENKSGTLNKKWKIIVPGWVFDLLEKY